MKTTCHVLFYPRSDSRGPRRPRADRKWRLVRREDSEQLIGGQRRCVGRRLTDESLISWFVSVSLVNWFSRCGEAAGYRKNVAVFSVRTLTSSSADPTMNLQNTPYGCAARSACCGQLFVLVCVFGGHLS